MTPRTSLREAALGRLAAQWTALGGQLDGPCRDAGRGPRGAARGDRPPRARRAPHRRGRARLEHQARFGGQRRPPADRGGRARRGRRTTAELAAAVRRAGGPPWPVTATGEPMGPWEGIEPRPGLVVVRDLAAPARLVWRLRAGFGVNARADILAVLLVAPAPLSIADLAARTRFGKRAVAGAVADMALAGLADVERTGQRGPRPARGRSAGPGLAGGARCPGARRGVSMAMRAGRPRPSRTDRRRPGRGPRGGGTRRDRHPSPSPRGWWPARSRTRPSLGAAFASEVDAWLEALAAAIAP